MSFIQTELLKHYIKEKPNAPQPFPPTPPRPSPTPLPDPSPTHLPQQANQVTTKKFKQGFDSNRIAHRGCIARFGPLR